MAADNYQERLAYGDRELPWQGFGTPFDGAEKTAEEATAIAQCDYPVMLGTANAYELLDAAGNPSGNMVSGNMLEENTKSNGIMVLRGPSYGDPNYAVLGKSSDRFVFFQNMELARLVEPFRKFGRIATVGALGKGERFFICFEGDEWAAVMPDGKRDEHKSYLVVKDTKLPGSTLQFQLTEVRVVCKNTWMAADRAAAFNIPLVHAGDMKKVAEWVTTALATLPEERKNRKAIVERMARTTLSEKDVRNLIDYAIPMPIANRATAGLKGIENIPELEKVLVEAEGYISRKDEQTRVMQSRIESQRNAAMLTYHSSDTVRRGTVWGGLQATIESIDHTVRTHGNTKQTSKSRLAAFWGEKTTWKVRAWDAAMEYVK